MIEVPNIQPRQVKGTTAQGKNYHFFNQTCVLHSVDQDGIPLSGKFEISSEPGALVNPGNQYAIDPSCCYIGRDANGRDRLMLRRNVKLIAINVGVIDKQKAA